jgi:hypothetical protein
MVYAIDITHEHLLFELHIQMVIYVDRSQVFYQIFPPGTLQVDTL